MFAIGTAILIPHYILHNPMNVIVTAPAPLFALEGLLLVPVTGLMMRVAQPFLGNVRLWG